MSEEHTPTYLKLPWHIRLDAKAVIRDNHGAVVLLSVRSKEHTKFTLQACNSYDQDQAKIESLVAACEAALRIEDLWRPGQYSDCPAHEGVALSAMGQKIEAALKSERDTS